SGAELGLALPVRLDAAHVQSETETLAAPDRGFNPRDMGRVGSHRDTGLRARLRRADPGSRLRPHRSRRPSSGAGTAARLPGRRHSLPGSVAPMMFIIRTAGDAPSGPGFTVRATRRTPDLAGGGTRDFFCDGAIEAARQSGWPVVPLHD